MAKFIFSLQSILEIKQKMETQAKQEFSLAMNHLDEEEEKLKALYDRQEMYRENARNLLKGTLKIREIEDNKRAISLMDDYIAQQKVVIVRAKAIVEKAREKMSEAVKDRRTYDILREQAFEEFMREENKAESKAVDELVSYTYGLKVQHEQQG